jgi:hypothetical protein
VSVPWLLANLREPTPDVADEQRLENTYQTFHALKLGAAFPVKGRPDLADRFDRIDALDAAHECRHGRLAGDRTPPCGCWPQQEGFGVVRGERLLVRVEEAA